MSIALRTRTRKPANPQADPRFKKVLDQLKQKSAQIKKHPTAKQKAAEAAAAAKGPANEKRAGAKGNQVDKIKEAPTDKPKPDSFLSLLRAEIQKAMPKTLGDTEKFMKGGDSESLKGSLKGNVSEQKDKSAEGVSSNTKAAPNEGGVQAKQAQPVPGEPAPASPEVNGGQAMPAPKPDAEVSLQDSKKDTDQAMKDAEVTTPQMNKANDPRFTAVVSAKDEVAKQADAGPGQYRAKETVTLNSAAVKATTESKKGAVAMLKSKSSSKASVLSRQDAAKAKDEAARKKVADDIEAIYNATKTNVETKLNTLETEVNSIFDSGTEAALNQMKSFVEDKIFDYKVRRYLSIPVVGAARWIRDQFKGLPDEVNAFYVEGRNLFTRLMDVLVVKVANLVEQRLREAKAEVAKGQAKIKAYVAGLSPDLKKVGLAAEKEVAGRFTELEQGIEDKKNQLAQSLAEKYKEGFEKADQALKEIQDSNKGLVAGFIAKLGEIIKIILEFKGKLMAVLRKGWDTIKLILADPIGFLGNLLAALKQGVGQFVGNIWTHLKKGFMEWLFGTLSSAGVEIPSDLSLPSILKLVLGVLGLTPARIEQEATKLLGPTAVTVIKKLIEYVKAIVEGGPAKLWEQIKQDIGDLKAMVIDAIQSWLIETVVKQATIKLLSFFNPAGAFVQACIAIYNVVMFIVERASQIMAFVEAVINSVHAIATGAIGGAANWIEQSLARLIPVVISFLARLIGLGGISQKIKEFITKVQNTVWNAIRKALKKIIDTVKKLIGKLTGRNKDENRTDSQAQQDLDKAAAEAQQLQNQPGVTPERFKARLPGIKSKYKLAVAELVKDQGSTYHIELSINPRKKTSKKDYKAKWSLAPGGFEAHDGTVIIAATATRPAVTVHMVSRHGPDVPNSVLIGRLMELRTTYNQERATRIRQAEIALGDAETALARGIGQGENSLNQARTPERRADVQTRNIRDQARLQEQVNTARVRLVSLRANNSTDVDGMYKQLEEWRVNVPPRATRFRRVDVMNDSVKSALEKGAKTIDEAFTDEGGNPRPVGTRVVVRDTFKGEIGVGYELDQSHQAVPIARQLKSVVVYVRVIDPNNRQYVVETAYPEGL